MASLRFDRVEALWEPVPEIFELTLVPAPPASVMVRVDIRTDAGNLISMLDEPCALADVEAAVAGMADFNTGHQLNGWCMGHLLDAFRGGVVRAPDVVPDWMAS